MSLVSLPDFRHSDTSKWYQQKLTNLVEYLIDENGMPDGNQMGIVLIKNCPLVYNNALLDEDGEFSNSSLCNASASNIGPFVPKKEWKIDGNTSYTIDDMNGQCTWNISGVIVDLPDCSLKYLDPTSRYDSSDVIGAQGTMCPVARSVSSMSPTTTYQQHIFSHNVYALQHVKETSSSVSTITNLNNTFIFTEYSSSTVGEHSAVFGSRFPSSWQGIKVSFLISQYIFCQY